MENVLIIEDDVSILKGLIDNLEYEGYTVFSETNGVNGLNHALGGNPDLILLDIMLPGLNGYEICKRVKREKPDLPVIMITARGAEMDKVSGLDIGADDYVTKPFSIPELLARIRAVFRRANNSFIEHSNIQFAHVCIDFKKLQARVAGKEVNLSSKEYEILKYLSEHEGEPVHRHDLLNNVWGYEKMPTTRTVDNFVLNLRKKLEKNPSEPKHIISVRGVGYKFVK